MLTNLNLVIRNLKRQVALGLEMFINNSHVLRRIRHLNFCLNWKRLNHALTYLRKQSRSIHSATNIHNFLLSIVSLTQKSAQSQLKEQDQFKLNRLQIPANQSELVNKLNQSLESNRELNLVQLLTFISNKFRGLLTVANTSVLVVVFNIPNRKLLSK